MRAARAFDAQVGKAWHFMIPYKFEGYAVDAVFSEEHYDYAATNLAINKLGLTSASLPAIVFEITPDRDHYFLRLNGRSDAGILRLIESIGDIAIELHRTGPHDPVHLRQDAAGQIARYLFGERALSFAAKSLPAVAGLLGMAANAKDLVSA